MAEMHFLARFITNVSAARRNRRRYDWIRSTVSFPPGATFLEIGCGNGDMAARIVDGVRPARYVATDLDARQLDAARRNLSRRYPAGVPAALELQPADMLHLAFPSESFDAVFAFLTIHHVGESHHDFTRVPEALAGFDRVLRPQGYLVYEEFLHKDRIRAWLTEHGYSLLATRTHRRQEAVVARKGARVG